MPIRISGAPNFRVAEGTNLAGVGQPTASGVRAVLNYLRAARRHGQHSVLWVNLREEACCYVNSRPFVLRDMKQVRRVCGRGCSDHRRYTRACRLDRAASRSAT